MAKMRAATHDREARPQPTPAQRTAQRIQELRHLDRAAQQRGVLSFWFHVVIVDKKGNPYNVLVLHLTEPGRTEDGDEVTAWCRGAAGDLVADSMRVDARPARQRSPEPPPYQPPAMPP